MTAVFWFVYMLHSVGLVNSYLPEIISRVYDFTRTHPLCYVLVNNGGKESRRGSQVDCFFSYYVYVPVFLRILSVHILCFKNETNVPFNLMKNTYLHLRCLQNSACGCRHLCLVTSGDA